jgi:molybdopterin-containing oxidoreductase family membrane subunit
MSSVVESTQPDTHEAADVIEVCMRPIRKASRKFWLGIVVLSAIVAFGVYAYVVQLRQGMGVAGYSDSSFWAIYIADVVAFIGVSYGGAVVSAILLLTGASWRAPLARLAEGMALVTVLIGAAFIFPHLGRPDRILGMVTQPNFASPVFWDMVAIITYTCVTFVFFLLPLVPDTAILRGSHPDELGRGRLLLYRVISRNWVGSSRQRKVLHSAILVVAIVIIPLAVSVHSVLSWAFALVSRPGWHESIWAPYFVIAALYSGVALVILVVAGFRRGYHLEAFITKKHFVYLGFIMAALGATYLYLTFADLLPGAYVGESGPNEIIHGMLLGEVAPWFWLFLVAGTIAPVVMVALPWTRNIWGMVIASALVVVAMWIKRVLMVVETASFDRLTGTFGDFFQFTWVSASITLAGAAAIPLLLMLLFRIVPILSIDEVAELEGHPIAVATTPREDMNGKGRRTVVVAGTVAFLLVGMGLLGLAKAQPAQAAETPAVPATMTVTASAAGPEVTVIATLTAGGQPVAGALVTLYQSTPMFAPGDNRFPLGKPTTDAEGQAKVTYVATETGAVTISGSYYATIDAEPVTAETPLQITEAISLYVPPEPRILASVGRTLVMGLFALVALVFIIVIVQVVRVRRATRRSEVDVPAPKEGITA